MSSFLQANLGRDHKKQIKEACQNFAYMDLRPFNATEGEGFILVCHTLLNVYCKLKRKVSKVEVILAVRERNTINRSAVDFEKGLRAKLLGEI